MGSENLFHKRKAKNNKRNKPNRKEYDKVLIVCEDSVSAPNYFKELIRHYKISSANVKIDGSCGSSPKCVLEYAQRLFKAEKIKGDAYDRVYCVFDKDSHASYQEIIAEIADKKQFYAAYSVPCFEYWLLLHFNNSTKPYSSKGKSSIANEVLKDLERHIPSYRKGDKGIFKSTVHNLDNAIQNAHHSLQQAINSGTDNPSTLIHELVIYLRDIKNQS